MSPLNRRDFLWLTAGGLAGMSAGCLSVCAEPDRPPNFLIILGDDLGAKELGCYGNPVHKTPNLDQLAATGVKFETCYATPLCHPTRLMMMTGQYGCHNGVYNFAGRRGGPDPKSPAEDMTTHFTFANLLKQQGYATALAGKWQLSGTLPTLIHECAFDEYCVWAYAHNLPEGVKHTGGYESDKKPSRYWHPCILKNGAYMPAKPEDYGPDLHVDFLLDFMKRNRERPFLAYHTMCLTHAPHMPTPDTLKPGEDRFQSGQHNFKAVVEYMDKLAGRLVEGLEALGLRENTIILFTTDNGTGGDGKGDPTELGARVPLIINAPKRVKARGTSMELTDLSDVFPTIAEFSGASFPKERVIDGRSLAPYLRGDNEHTREWIHSYLGDRRLLRTKRWLLEDNSPLHWGRLYDCGDRRDGGGYIEVTDSRAPEVLATKDQFNALLKNLPAPILEKDGNINEKKPARARKRK